MTGQNCAILWCKTYTSFEIIVAGSIVWPVGVCLWGRGNITGTAWVWVWRRQSTRPREPSRYPLCVCSWSEILIKHWDEWMTGDTEERLINVLAFVLTVFELKSLHGWIICSLNIQIHLCPDLFSGSVSEILNVLWLTSKATTFKDCILVWFLDDFLTLGPSDRVYYWCVGRCTRAFFWSKGGFKCDHPGGLL